MSKVTTAFALLKIDISDVKNQVSVTNIDLGFGIKYEFQQQKSGKKVTDAQIYKLKTEVQQFFVTMCKHMVEKIALNSYFVRCFLCLSPLYMVESYETCEFYFDKLLLKLVAYKKVLPSAADQAKLQYSQFITTVVKENREKFLGFKKASDRLNSFLFNIQMLQDSRTS